MKKDPIRRNAAQRILKERLGIVFGSALILLLVGTLVLLAWQKSSQRVTTDYEGRVVDRWGDYYETQQGSRPRLRLVVETDDGKRFIVKVEPNVYESAKVGMRIKSKSGQVELIDTEQRKSIGK
jgi:hypothetical protein